MNVLTSLIESRSRSVAVNCESLISPLEEKVQRSYQKKAKEAEDLPGSFRLMRRSYSFPQLDLTQKTEKEE